MIQHSAAKLKQGELQQAIREYLLDSALLNNLAPLIAATNGDACKREFGLSSIPSLPSEILHRKKTGFKTPIENGMENINIIATPGSNAIGSAKNMPWVRRWACTVMKHQLAGDFA